MLKFLLAATAAATLAFPVLAHDGPHISDPYARASAASGAIFLVIENHSDQDDRLIAASTDVAERTELHTHQQDANGVVQMIEVPDGFAIPAKGSHALSRGGDHIMLLGLKRPLAQGDTFPLTLTFERGEEITLEVAVDNDRKPVLGATGHGAADHSGHAAP